MSAAGNRLLYGVESIPRPHVAFLLACQQLLTMVGATLTMPVMTAAAVCMTGDTESEAVLLATMFFVSGATTLLQTTFGTRLPVVMGVSFAFVPAMFAMTHESNPEWRCPIVTEADQFNATIADAQYSNRTVVIAGSPEHRAEWQLRMRHVAGTVLVTSLLPTLLGATGLLGLFMRFVGPLTVGPTIALIGLALFDVIVEHYAALHWGISMTAFLLILIFSQLLHRVNFPRTSFKIFGAFPVLWAIALTTLLSVVLTVTGALASTSPGGMDFDMARRALASVDWVHAPAPAPYGAPVLTVAGCLGMLAAVLATVCETVGDYYACAAAAGLPPPPTHALSRGMLVEGLSCAFAALWSVGAGTTSYSENIGAISLTKSASRLVVQVAGLILIIIGLIPKLSMCFLLIPKPVVGGVLLLVFGLIVSNGISNLRHVDMTHSRNQCVFGIALFVGLAVPYHIKSHPVTTSIGGTLDNVVNVLLQTSMFVGGLIGFTLDNLLPGDVRMRGIEQFNQPQLAHGDADDAGDADAAAKAYDPPTWCYCKRFAPFFTKLPICPPNNERQRGYSEDSEVSYRSRESEPLKNKADSESVVGV